VIFDRGEGDSNFLRFFEPKRAKNSRLSASNCYGRAKIARAGPVSPIYMCIYGDGAFSSKGPGHPRHHARVTRNSRAALLVANEKETAAKIAALQCLAFFDRMRQ
jgi:hypothetical protein